MGILYFPILLTCSLPDTSWHAPSLPLGSLFNGLLNEAFSDHSMGNSDLPICRVLPSLLPSLFISIELILMLFICMGSFQGLVSGFVFFLLKAASKLHKLQVLQNLDLPYLFIVCLPLSVSSIKPGIFVILDSAASIAHRRVSGIQYMIDIS